MKDKKPASTEPAPDLQARLKIDFVKFEEIRGFL